MRSDSLHFVKCDLTAALEGVILDFSVIFMPGVVVCAVIYEIR